MDCYSIENIEIGKRIKELRNKNHLTQEGLAAILSINVNAVKAYEIGEYGPSKEVLAKLSYYFNISIDYILLGFTTTERDLTSLVDNSSDEIKLNILMRLYSYFSKKEMRFIENELE